MPDKNALQKFIQEALAEDIGTGDYSTLSCIPSSVSGEAILKIKEDGILAGMQVAEEIFRFLEPLSQFIAYKKDGERVYSGDIAFTIQAKVHTILKGERLVLNCMQRMSGIATLTRQYTEQLTGFHTRLLDTRKTTPNFRLLEKEAVKIGGGQNHRMGLYDMIMLKDNHIDYCGGIMQAVKTANEYLAKNKLSLPIEIETRNLQDVEEVMKVGKINRIMLDNFSPDEVATAVKMIGRKYETEASGGITLDNIRQYAETGVDFVSVGAIIHHATNLDMSLKAVII